MSPDEPRPVPDQLGRFWDDLVQDPATAPDDLDPALAEPIQQLHALDDAPGPDPALMERMWREAVRQADVTAPLTLDPARAPLPNGHARPTPTLATRRGFGRAESIRRATSRTVRTVAIGVGAGMVAGLVAGGGARLAMRITAMTAESSQRGALTENGNRLGEITLGGTASLLVFGGLVGIAGGLAYVAVKPWLPWSGLRRGLLFGLLLLATSGSVVMDPDNPDYRRFGSPGLNVCLFSLVYLGFGLIVAPLADRLDRAMPSTLPRRSGRFRTLGASAGVVVLALPGLLLIAGGATSGLLLAVILGVPLTRVLLGRWAGRFERPADLAPHPRLALAGYAVLLLPSLIGLALTVRAIGEILGAPG